MDKKFDVVIVGSGPSGASTAKALSGFGLESAILEKKRLPRYKMCSGIILPYAYKIILEHFGPLPENIFCQPKDIKGLRLSLSIDSSLIDVPVNLIRNGGDPLEFAKNIKRPELDYWLCKKSGANILDDCLFMDMTSKKERLILKVKYGGANREIEAKYLIGADGPMSKVRKTSFPDFDNNLRLISCYEEWYKGEIELEPGWLYAFYDRNITGFMATVFQKDDNIIVNNATAKGESTKNYFYKFYNYLKQRHGLLVKSLLKCHGIILNDMAATQNYCLGKGNILLVGEAAGFLRGTEGIGPALLSGRIAGESIKKSIKTGRPAEDFYKKDVLPVIEACTKRQKEREALTGYNIFTRK